MSRRTKGHYPFLLQFNRRESFHNPLLTYNPQSRSVQFYFSLPPGIFMSGLEKFSHMEIHGLHKPQQTICRAHAVMSWPCIVASHYGVTCVASGAGT